MTLPYSYSPGTHMLSQYVVQVCWGIIATGKNVFPRKILLMLVLRENQATKDRN